MDIFEAGMLVCFGASWPINILKSIRSKSTRGKSLLFMYVILIGYVCGITGKLVYDHDVLLIVLYAVNFVMVAIDICLFYRNKRLEGA
jgi:lipopolysaccharide export LptBFGC system permease protein LptF